MDYQQWTAADLSDLKDFTAFQTEALADLEAQLQAQGLVLIQTLPNNYRFGAVVGAADDKRWIFVGIDDVREQPDWFNNVKLRRMSSRRDWKGQEFHFCTWDAVGAEASKYLTPEYDDEIL